MAGGNGTLSTNLVIEFAVTAALSGAGSQGIASGVETTIAAQVTATSAIQVTVDTEYSVATAQVGTGALSATLGSTELTVAVSMPSVGAADATFQASVLIAAALTASGSLLSDVGLALPASVVLIGPSTMGAAVAISVEHQAAMAAAGALSATVEIDAGAPGEVSVSAILTGAGALAASVDIVSAVGAAPPPPARSGALNSYSVPIELVSRRITVDVKSDAIVATVTVSAAQPKVYVLGGGISVLGVGSAVERIQTVMFMMQRSAPAAAIRVEKRQAIDLAVGAGVRRDMSSIGIFGVLDVAFRETREETEAALMAVLT